jgi:hypothetical protein
MMNTVDQTMSQNVGNNQDEAVIRLRNETSAIRLHVRWLGIRKSLTTEQKTLAANVFDADRNVVSAAKILLDTAHPAFRAVSSIKTETVAVWRSRTLPYVEPGVRLIPRRDLLDLETVLRDSCQRLSRAVNELQDCFPEIVSHASERLGDLFDQSDYPSDLSEMFAISWDYPSMEVPSYLRQISPDVYRLECDRVRARFQEAVEVSELAFAEELREMVTHLADRLSGQEDGKPKVFRDSALTNLLEFFERFQRLNVTSNESLEALVAQGRELLGGTSAVDLRRRESLRTHVAAELSRIQSSIDSQLSDRPRRNIIRRSVA